VFSAEIFNTVSGVEFLLALAPVVSFCFNAPQKTPLPY